MNKLMCNFFCCFIPGKKNRRQFRLKHDTLRKLYESIQENIMNKLSYSLAQQNNILILQKLKEKASKGQKIRVCFLIVQKEVFPFKKIFELMLEDSVFEPFILVSRYCNCNWLGEYKSDYFSDIISSMQLLYGKTKVYSNYNMDKGEYLDYSNLMDICFISTPYVGILDNYTQPRYLITKGVLTILLSYGFFISSGNSKSVASFDISNIVWKIPIETYYDFNRLIEEQPIGGLNTFLSGYIKMDQLIEHKIKDRNRKCIIIASHHSSMNRDRIPEFVKYNRFFLELPRIYKDLDFIFRFHPLTMKAMVDRFNWTQETVNNYIKELKSNPNVIINEGWNYFDVFVNSDGMIHDCGSFMCEYLYTDKPQLYLLKDKTSKTSNFNKLGRDVIDNLYQGFSEEDIIKFIDNVIIKGIDPMKNERVIFANREIKINYPDASKVLLEYIKKSLIL